MNGYGAALALYLFAAAVELVEAFAPYLDGGGHRRGLEELAREAPRGGVESRFVGERGIRQDGYVAVGVQSVGDGAEAGGGGVGLIEAGYVAGEAGGAANEEDEEAGGKRVESAGVPNLRLPGQEALDL